MTLLNSHGYPASWPQANDRLDSIVSRITHTQKLALYTKQVTTRELAKTLNVRESYLSRKFPGKVPSGAPFQAAKRALRVVRMEYRFLCAEKVLEKTLSILEAAKTANTTYRSMARAVQALKHTKANHDSRV